MLDFQSFKLNCDQNIGTDLLNERVRSRGLSHGNWQSFNRKRE